MSDTTKTPWGLSTDAALASYVRSCALERERHELENRLADVNREHAREARRAGCDTAFAYCQACGSRNVEWEDWVDAQTGLATGSMDCGRNWCPRCEDGDASITFEREEAALARYSWRRRELDGCTCGMEYERGEAVEPHDHGRHCPAWRAKEGAAS